jgi:hypothetical protein
MHLIHVLINIGNLIIPWIVGLEILGKGFLEGMGLFDTIVKWCKKKKLIKAGRAVKAKKIEKKGSPLVKFEKEEKRHKKTEKAEEAKHERREETDFKDIEKLAEKKSKFKRK